MIGVGARTISEAGAVGDLSRQQLELFSISQLFHCMVDADDESLYFDCTFTPSKPPSADVLKCNEWVGVLSEMCRLLDVLPHPAAAICLQIQTQAISSSMNKIGAMCELQHQLCNGMSSFTQAHHRHLH